MPYFPQFMSSKATVQLGGYQSAVSFKTVLTDMDSGARHSLAMYGGGFTNYPTGPLGRYEISLTLTDAELTTLRDFFESVKGRLEEFIFIDPVGNMIQYSEDFSQSAWEKNGVSVGGAYADPFGGLLAKTLTATTSNSNINAMVLPDGGADGLVVTGSVWCRARSAGQQLAVGFIDPGFTVLSYQVWDLPQNQWARVSHTYVVATSSYIRLLLGGFGSWNSTVIDVFGAQCVAAPGADGYAKSPACYAIRPRCRFDTDELKWKKIGPNQNMVSFAVKEIY